MPHSTLRVLTTFWVCSVFTVAAGCATTKPRDKAAGDDFIRAGFASATQPVKSAKDFPPVVLKELAKIAGVQQIALADPNEDYNRVPKGRQLIFATRSKEFFLVSYMVRNDSMAAGSRVVLLCLYSSTYVIPLLVAQDLSESRDLTHLREAFAQGKLNEYRPTYIDF